MRLYWGFANLGGEDFTTDDTDKRRIRTVRARLESGVGPTHDGETVMNGHTPGGGG